MNTRFIPLILFPLLLSGCDISFDPDYTSGVILESERYPIITNATYIASESVLLWDAPKQCNFTRLKINDNIEMDVDGEHFIYIKAKDFHVKFMLIFSLDDIKDSFNIDVNFYCSIKAHLIVDNLISENTYFSF